MEKYISKSAVITEIEDWRDNIKKGIFSIPLSGRDKAYATFEYEILGKVKDFLDTFEVKEVDLKKEIEKYLLTNAVLLIEGGSELVINHMAKHFFELGINTRKI